MSSRISSTNFYSKGTTTRHRFKTRSSLSHTLEAVRKDPSLRIQSFPTQQQAIDHVIKQNLSLKLWSNEIDKTGKRRYVTGSYKGFWRFYSRCLRRPNSFHFYEVIRERHPCKLYFDLEYKRGENNCDGEKMVEALIAMVAKITGGTVRRHSEDVAELDSTTEDKFSRHLIFECIAFHDNIQAGVFAHRVVDALCEEDENLVMINKGQSRVPFVDLGVYTKNRCFRIVGSSKYARTARLLQLGHHPKARVALSRQFFIRSLVCSVKKSVTLRGTPSPWEQISEAGSSCHKVTPGISTYKREYASRYPHIDGYIYSIIEPCGGGINSVTTVGEDSLIYAIKGGYKYCDNIGRHHKSNNVMLVVELEKRRIHQKCFDPDCRGFRSQSRPIPEIVFEASDNEALDLMAEQVESLFGSVNKFVLNTIMNECTNDSDESAWKKT